MKDSWLRGFIKEKGLNGRIIETGKVSTVDEAAKEMNCEKSMIIKSVVFVSESGKGVVCVVDGLTKVDTQKVEKVIGKKTRIAGREEVRKLTGFLAGGVPPIGHGCLTIIDFRVMEKDVVYGGGGDEYHLIEIKPEEIIKGNSGRVIIDDIGS